MAENKIIAQQIKLLRAKMGWTQEQLADKMGVSKQSVSNWETGFKVPRMGELQKLSDIFKVNIGYITDGEVKFPNFELRIATIINKLDDSHKDKVLSYAERQLEEQNNILKFPDRINEDNNNTVLNYGYVSAGTGEYMIDNQPEEITVHGGIPADYDFAVTINGDSMEPMFADGQVIFVRNTVEAISGQIVIAELNGDAYVKKLQADESSCRLVSLNSKYKPINIDEDDDFKVVGVVVL